MIICCCCVNRAYDNKESFLEKEFEKEEASPIGNGNQLELSEITNSMAHEKHKRTSFLSLEDVD